MKETIQIHHNLSLQASADQLKLFMLHYIMSAVDIAQVGTLRLFMHPYHTEKQKICVYIFTPVTFGV
jgi:hypothetical protein